MPESLVCKYCILFRGYSVAKSKKDVLPRNKAAYLHLVKLHPKQSVQIKIEMFHPMTGVLLLFACFVSFLYDLSQLPGWCYWLVPGMHWSTDETLYLKKLETNLPPPPQKKLVCLSLYRPRGKRIWTRMTIFSWLEDNGSEERQIRPQSLNSCSVKAPRLIENWDRFLVKTSRWQKLPSTPPLPQN